MDHVTHRSHRMQKLKFKVTCPGALLRETSSGPAEHEKYCAHISCPGLTGMDYMTRISHRIQKYNSGVTCPGALFVESVPLPTEHEK
jgi:hypothetical protein